MKKITSKSVVFGVVNKKHFAFLVNLFKIVRIAPEDKEFFDLYYNKKKTIDQIKFLVENNHYSNPRDVIYLLENLDRNYINVTNVKRLFFKSINLFDKEKKPIDKENVLEKLEKIRRDKKVGVTLLGFRDRDIFDYPNIKVIAEYCRKNDMSIEIVSKTNSLPPSRNILKIFENINTKVTIRAISKLSQFTTKEFLSTLYQFSFYGIKLQLELNKYHEKFHMIQKHCERLNIPVLTIFYEKDYYPKPI